MAWLSRVNFVSSDTLSFSDINNLGNDIRAWGDNVNGGGYTLSNVVLSASSGTMATVTGGTSAASTLTIRSTSGTGTSDAIVFQTASQLERMRITSGGNIGIGTTSPAYQAQVNGSGQTTAALTDAGNKGGSILIADTGAAGGNGGALLFAASVANGFIPGCAIKSLLLNGFANGQSDLAFSTRNAASDTSLTERMRITYNGNVGIGTTSPVLALHVVGTQGGPATSGTTPTGTARFVTVNSVMDIGSRSNGNTWMQVADRTNLAVSYNLELNPNGGNVGIGTASPATSAKLEIAGTTGALLVPRLTTTERNALTAVNGMIIYNTTDNQMQGRINGAWVAM
jgi:hypothetical protein